MKKGKDIASVVISVIATIYTIWYMHFGVSYKNEGALSKIGLSHPVYFGVWGMLTFIALAFGITLAYKRNTRTKAYIPMLIISGVGMILTLANDFDYDKKLQYFLHCGGSLAFSVTMGICIFVLFLLCYNKNTIYKAFTFISGGILVIDFICLLIFKETGLIEVLPIFAGYLMLGITNTRRDKVEITR